jgi:hypothetical protein
LASSTPYNFTIPGVFQNGQLTGQAQSAVEGLPGTGDAGAGTNLPPLPTNSASAISSLSNPSDISAYAASAAGQPLDPGIFTVSSSTPTNVSSINTINNTVGASSQAINNAANNVLGTLPGSLAGVDAGMGALSFTNVSQTAQTSAIRSNILHNYKNYTYRLALQMLDPSTYNTIIQNPAAASPTNVLIASGGIYGSNTFIRSPYFTDDFYFENLQMETVIGPNSDSRGSNVISINFTIIEPYGCTLLNRLIDATAALNGQSYLEVPYVMQIDFTGYDNNGNPVNPIPGTTKIIPMKLLTLKFNVTNKGSEYKIEAAPYNHSAYEDTTATIPVNFEIAATTLSDLFSATSKSDWTQQYAANNQRTETNQAATTQQIQAMGNTATGNQIQAVLATNNPQTSGSNGAQAQNYKVIGIADALNKWNKYLVNTNMRTVADQYAFVIDDNIATSTISLTHRTDIKNTQFAQDQDSTPLKDAARSSLNQSVFTIDYKKNTFRINAGTTIIDLISNLLTNSDFISNQITDPYNNSTNGTQATQSAGTTANNTTTATTGGSTNTTSTTNNNPLYYWKIVPEIEILGYDTHINRYARKITYHIKRYQMNNIRYPYAPQGKATSYLKDYQYLFTGQNIDIIDVNLNFECLFYTAITAFGQKNQDIYNQASTDQTNKISNTQSLQSAPGVITPARNMPISNNMSAISAGYTSKDIKTILASDLTHSIFAKSQGDMMQVDLTIIGDPDWIKQDDIFIVDSTIAPQLNGSLPMDNGEVYVRLIFKTGTDYDPNTGLLRNGSSQQYNPGQNVFSGLYKVLTVMNNFADGQFTQVLSMVRLFDQPQYDYGGSSQNTVNSERSASGNDESTSSQTTNLGTGLFSGGGVSSINNSVAENASYFQENLNQSFSSTNPFTTQQGVGGTGTQANTLNVLVTGTGNSSTP